jgi:hypothetical protein
MNRDDDFIGQLEDYLDTFEGVVPLPANVRSAVQARLPETRQVRGSRGPERLLEMTSRMSTPARLGIGAAAVLGIVVLGAAALNVSGSAPGVGAVRTAPSSPSAEPSREPASPGLAISPSPTDRIPILPRSGFASCGPGVSGSCNAAGRYRLSSLAWPATVSIDLPTGWWTYAVASDFEGVLVENGDTPDGSGWGVIFMTVRDVSRDPCDPDAGKFGSDETASVEGLVAAMRSWPGFDVSPATPIEIDGYAGQLVDVTSARTASDCPAATIWSTVNGTAVDGYPMVGEAAEPRPGQFRILDVEGELVVIRTTNFGDASPHELGQGIEPDPDRHAEDQVELRAIVDSIQITP